MRPIKTVLPILMLAATVSPPAHAVIAPLTTYTASLHGSIDIAPGGSVQDYSLPTLQGADNRALAQALDHRIRSWRFVPVTNDGRPVIAHVLFGITLQADAKADGKELAVSMSDLKFYDLPAPDASGKPAAPLRPPMFPYEPMRAGVGAEVTVVFKLDDDGRVLNSDVSKMDLLLASAIGHDLETRYAKDFRKATLAVAKDWAFPANYRTTCGKPCLLQVPVEYSLPDKFWSGVRSIALPALPWASPETPIVGLDPSGGIASTRQLIDPAQGTGQL